MELTIAEIARLIGGQIIAPPPSDTHAGGEQNGAASLEGNAAAGAQDPGSLSITGVASLAEAGEGDITFFGNQRYLPQLKATRATCALVPQGFSESIPAVAIAVENPSLAFATVVARMAPPPIEPEKGIHPRAVIAEGVTLGEGVSIQANAVIEPGAVIGDHVVIGANCYVGHEARIGADSRLYPNVVVRERCILGERVTIHSGTVVGSDGYGYEFSQGRHVKIPQTGIVMIDNDVEIGANVAIDRARFGRTWIGEGTKIDNLVQIAHNVVIGKHSLIISQAGLAGSSRLGNYVTIAGQVGIVGHVEVGDQSIVAAQSGVSKNLPPKSVVWGTPCAPIQEHKTRLALINRLPRFAEKLKQLEALVASLRS